MCTHYNRFVQFKKSSAHSPNILLDISYAYISTCVYAIHTILNFAFYLILQSHIFQVNCNYTSSFFFLKKICIVGHCVDAYFNFLLMDT